MSRSDRGTCSVPLSSYPKPPCTGYLPARCRSRLRNGMMGMLRLGVATFGIAILAGTAAADVIELKTGQRVEGDVLKEQGDVLYVDLGFEVLRVPASQVRSRSATSASSDGKSAEVS